MSLLKLDQNVNNWESSQMWIINVKCPITEHLEMKWITRNKNLEEEFFVKNTIFTLPASNYKLMEISPRKKNMDNPSLYTRRYGKWILHLQGLYVYIYIYREMGSSYIWCNSLELLFSKPLDLNRSNG